MKKSVNGLFLQDFPVINTLASSEVQARINELKWLASQRKPWYTVKIDNEETDNAEND